MYIVTIINNGKRTEIHNEHYKLFSGSIVKGINTIDSFTFSALPSNPAWGAVNDFKTLVEVYNTTKKRYDFYGRVLYSTQNMAESGLLTQEVTCESYLGFLCDSIQAPVATGGRIRSAPFLEDIIAQHNAQVEDYKKFTLRTVYDISVKADRKRDTTWKIIQDNLLSEAGEIQFCVDNGVTYIDFVEKLGEKKTTEIAVSKNMKAITKEKDPSSFITRLFPLGAKITDGSEERYTIESVNNGKNYIDDEASIEAYGIHCGYVEFDDVTSPADLLFMGQAWLTSNNKVAIKYSVTALDLSLIGLAIDDFSVGNYYPIKNALLGIDDTARVTKKTINICEELKTTIEIGESFKTLSEIQQAQIDSLKKINADIQVIVRDYELNQKKVDELTKTVSLIQQSAENITLTVSAGKTTLGQYVEDTAVLLAMKVGRDENDQIVSMLNASADIITLLANRLIIESDNFKLSKEGHITAESGTIGDFTLKDGRLQSEDYGSSSEDVEIIENATTYSQGLTYTLTADGTSYIVSGIGDCTDTEIIIPDAYNGLPVKSIGNSAFENNQSITRVAIPDSVTRIGMTAFALCANLTSVDMGEGVSIIRTGAFRACSSLKNIAIPDNVVTIENEAFSSCTALEKVFFSEHSILEEIQSSAFNRCIALTAIALPDFVTTIKDYAFSNCTGLVNITLGTNLTSLNEKAFQGCLNLQHICYTGSLENWNDNGLPDQLERYIGSTKAYFTVSEDVYFYNSSPYTAVGNMWFYPTPKGLCISNDEIIIDTENFTLYRDGRVVAKNAMLYGKMRAESVMTKRLTVIDEADTLHKGLTTTVNGMTFVNGVLVAST